MSDRYLHHHFYEADMRALNLFILVLFSSSFLYAQHTIRGAVTDESTGQPLVGAVVYIPDLKTGTTTDMTGAFVLKKIPRRNFLLHVSLIGYASKVISASSKDSAVHYMVALRPSETELQEVIITGVASGTEQLRNPIPNTMQHRDVALQQPSANVVDRLSKVPGVSLISTGNGIAKPVIRGLSYNRVVTLRDGLRQEGQQWGDEHGIEIDEYEIDRTEIIKGPGSIMYGSDAMAGVVNNVTPKPVDEGKLVGEVLTNYQANGNLLGTSLMQAGNIDGTNWLVRFSRKKAGNYSSPKDGLVFNSGFEEYNGSGFIGVNRVWGYSHLHVSTFNQQIGLIEGERDSLGRFIRLVAVNDTLDEEQPMHDDVLDGYQNSIAIPFQQIRHNRIAWLNSIFFGESKLSIDASWQQNRRREYADLFRQDAFDLQFLLDTYNGEVKYMLPEVSGWNITAGIGAQHQTNDNAGIEFLIPEYAMTDIGGFLFAQKDGAPVLISGGMRYDFRTVDSRALYLDAEEKPVDFAHAAETKFRAFGKDFSTLSAGAGISYQFDDGIIGKFNVASGFRAPNISELGSNGKHEGAFRYEIGNPALDPERSLQFDAGFSVNTEHLSIDAGGFYSGISNYIFPEKLNSVAGGDSIVDAADPAPVFQFVQGDAFLYGGEVTIDVHPHPYDWLHWETSFSYVRGMQSDAPDSLRNLPFMPAPKIDTEIRAQFTRYGTLQNLYVKVEGEYYFPQNDFYGAYGTETATSGYLLMSAGAGVEIVNAHNAVWCKVYLSVSNLFDTRYQSHLSRLKYAPVNPATGERGVFNPGRNISVKAIVPLEF